MTQGSLLRFPGYRAAEQRYVRELTSIYQRQTWIDDPDFALASDDDIYRKLERDPVIFHAVQIRTLSVVGQSWHVEPASDEDVDKDAAAVVEDLLKQIREFNQARAHIFRSGLLSGRGYGWIRGRRRRMSIDNGPAQNWWVPERIEHQDKRSFHFVPEHEEGGDPKVRRVSQRLQFWSIARSEWVDLAAAERRALIRLTYENRADLLGHGQGIAVPLFLYFRAKGLAWMYLQQYNEQWGTGGTIIARVDGSREGATDKTNEDVRDAYLDTIEDMRSRHAFVFDKLDEVTVLGPATGADSGPIKTIEYCDKATTRLILGSLRPTGGETDTGGRAQAEVEQEVTDIITQFDRMAVDEALTEHLIRALWELNRPLIVSRGLGKAKMPKFVTSVDRKADPEKAIAVITQALQNQIPLRKEDVYTALDFKPPAEGEDVFEGSPPQPVGGGSPFLSEEGAFFTAQMERLAGMTSGARDSELSMFAKKPARCPDGTIAPKSGDCSGHGGAAPKDETKGRRRTQEKPPAGPPGSQLPKETRGLLKGLGVTKLPSSDSTEVQVHDLSASDVNSRAVMTWRDRGGKLQHAYTADFHRQNAAKKWDRVVIVEPQMDSIRSSFASTLGSFDVGSPDHEGATIGAVIGETGLRPGNPSSVKGGHFGISTLRRRHIDIQPDGAHLSFIGKSGKLNETVVQNPETIQALRSYVSRTDSPDDVLFSGKALSSARSAMPKGVKLKDMRTVIATQTARAALADAKTPPPLNANPKRAKRQIRRAIIDASTRVASKINNTPAIAKASYIHPNVFAAWAKSRGIPEGLLT